MAHITTIPDYRQPLEVKHKLSFILLLTICDVISGADGDATALMIMQVQDGLRRIRTLHD